MTGVKLSVSLTEGDVSYLDGYARRHGVGSRSGVLREALAYLRAQELEADYAAAFDEWDDAEAWEAVAADGLDAPR